MNAYHDPLGRAPKGHLHISSQPPPPHPNSSADETSFRPTSECSQPMFPDASFDVSTNKSTATCSHRRPLLSPHMNPPPLPPNTPSMYSGSLQPPVPTSVHRNERWVDSDVPPSPIQIINSRQSVSTPKSREAREPHNDGSYLRSTRHISSGDRELRQPPSPPNGKYYSDPHDMYYHSSRDSFARNDTRYEHKANNQHFNETDHTIRYNNGINPNHDQNSRKHSNKTHHYCNCDKCNNFRQQRDADSYGDRRNRCLHDLHPSRDEYYNNNGQGNNMQPDTYGSYGEIPNHSNQYIRHKRQQPPPNYSGQIEENDHVERRDYGIEASDNYRPHERLYHSIYNLPFVHNDGIEKRNPQPQSPLSPLTYEERAPSNHGWSPKSDNAILQADESREQPYAVSNSSNKQIDHAYQRVSGKDRRYYGVQPVGDEEYHDDYAPSNTVRSGNPNMHGKREPAQPKYLATERLSHPVHYNSGEIPTHVSYQAHESRHERHYSNISPDRRDDYSGSTIPTYSTVTPTRPSYLPQGHPTSSLGRAHHSPQQHRVQEGARPNLRVDIPNNAQYYPIQQTSHIPDAKTSRSNGNRPLSAASYQQPPYTSRSEPAMSQQAQFRAANAEKEREKSEARHQILKEIHQATNMRNSALDDNDRSFWDRQIATLNESFKRL